MRKIQILWTDDEIELLKPHIIFLERKGYEVDTATNGQDALEKIKNTRFDLVFLDENMPGISGLETLTEIKKLRPSTPVIMITKSEEENIMDEAIGNRISDYLIKPVNPNQILLTIKKHVDTDRLVSEKTSMEYQMQFRQLAMKINAIQDETEWREIYKELVDWEMKIEGLGDNTLDDILKMQKEDANTNFSRFVSKNYFNWLDPKQEEKPLMSHQLLKQKVFPLLKENRKVFLFVIDNLRYDHWKAIQPILQKNYYTLSDDTYFSIIPTATQYARNAIFSGLMPSEINKVYPDLWKNDHEEGGKNEHEDEMLKKLTQRFFGSEKKVHYEKVFDIQYVKKIQDRLNNLLQNDLNAIVINFVDMLSHARTDMKMIKDLTGNEAAYRSITKSWFEHSPLLDLFSELAKHKIDVIITTDHGSIRVEQPVKVIGDRETTTNLRYKQGRNLGYNRKEVFEITNPEKAYLPKSNISSSYIFALNNDFLVYPNNYNHYVNMYEETFQHGGISMEEMLIPIVHLSPRN